MLHRCYKKKYTKTIPPVVISVGNISAGGTGKTVVVQLLSRLCADIPHAIIMRGYGRQSYGALRVSCGKGPIVAIEDAGDEAFLIASQTQADVIVAKNRFSGWLLLKNDDKFANRETKIVILDDGYQNYNLAKNLEILLLDARAPFANGHCLPAGPLRENNITRAHCTLMTRSDGISSEAQTHIVAMLRSHGLQGPVFFTRHSVSHIESPGGDVSVATISGKRVCVVSGLGNNDAFVTQCMNMHVTVVATMLYADHYWYTPDDVDAIVAQVRACDAVMLTTAKDWVKLQRYAAVHTVPWYVVHIGIEFLSTTQYHDFVRLIQHSVESAFTVRSS